MFLVMCLKKEHPIEVLGKEVPVPLLELAVKESE